MAPQWSHFDVCLLELICNILFAFLLILSTFNLFDVFFFSFF